MLWKISKDKKCDALCKCFASVWSEYSLNLILRSAQKMKSSMKDFFSKYDQIRKNCGFGHIYWRNPYSNRKPHFLCNDRGALKKIFFECVDLYGKNSFLFRVEMQTIWNNSDTYLGPCQISAMKLFAKIVNGWKP